MSYRFITENGQIRSIPVDNSAFTEMKQHLCDVGTRFVFVKGMSLASRVAVGIR